MELTDSLNLTNDILFAKKLEKPVVAFFLHHFDLTDVFHIRVYTNPQYRVVIELLAEYILSLRRKVLELKLVHFKLLHVLVEHDLGSLARCSIMIRLTISEAVTRACWAHGTVRDVSSGL